MEPKKTYYIPKKKVLVRDEQSTPEARAERLRRVRNLANLTREAMCLNSELNANTLKGWEIARYGGLPQDGAEKVVARVAQEGVTVTTDWLLYEIGVGPQVITDFKKAKADKKKKTQPLTLQHEEQLIINELMLFRSQFSHAVDFKVADDAMEPYYKPGEYVAGVKRFGKNIRTLVGRACIVQTANGITLLRVVRDGQTPDRYTLMCFNTQTTAQEPILYNVELTSAAPVARHYCTND